MIEVFINYNDTDLKGLIELGQIADEVLKDRALIEKEIRFVSLLEGEAKVSSGLEKVLSYWAMSGLSSKQEALRKEHQKQKKFLKFLKELEISFTELLKKRLDAHPDKAFYCNHYLPDRIANEKKDVKKEALIRIRKIALGLI